MTTRENERKQENVSEGELVVFLGETIVNAIVILQIEEVTYLAIINIFLFYFHAINQLCNFFINFNKKHWCFVYIQNSFGPFI